MRRLALLFLVLAAGVFVFAGCGGGDDDGGGGDDSVDLTQSQDVTIAMVTHGDGGSFWSVAKKGAEKAAEDLGVTLKYSESNNDPEEQAQLIEAAVTEGVDGLAVSAPNPDAIRDALATAKDAGIPIITLNSGADQSQALGAITHVGQDEAIAGQGAGQRLAADGATRVLCVLHEAGNIGLEQRCDGASQGLGSEVIPLQVDINDLQAAQSTITSELQSDTGIDAVLTLNSAVAAVAVAAVGDAGSQAEVATFDLNQDVISGIQDGSISFAVDQQQYEQGYLPIVMLKLYAENLNTVGGGQPVLTGPGIVDADNVDEIADLASKGTR
jgi:simple sugar transport system substrate-binding protein